jgi:hypothetical protein
MLFFLQLVDSKGVRSLFSSEQKIYATTTRYIQAHGFGEIHHPSKHSTKYPTDKFKYIFFNFN